MSLGTVYDYSAGRPAAWAIKDSGAKGVLRYCGYPNRLKCITGSEFHQMQYVGVSVGLVFENAVGDWRGGLSAGRDFGKLAREHANSIGFPRSRPIYAAIDEDVVSPSDFNVMGRYLEGFGSVQGGPSLTGVYGENDVLDFARHNGLASYFWQTKAWSKGVLFPGRHLFQNAAQQFVDGVQCDVNMIEKADWGQHDWSGMELDSKLPPFTDPDTGEVSSYTVAEYLQWTNEQTSDLKNKLVPGLIRDVSALTAKVDALTAQLALLLNGGTKLVASGEIRVTPEHA